MTTPHGALDVTTPLIGRGNLANVLAATAVAIQFDVPLEAIADRAARLQPAAHRGQVVRLPTITVIDDSYNANPTATRTALQVLAGEANASRRVAVLGEMLELGDRAIALHEDVGRAAAAAGVDVLVAVGGDLRGGSRRVGRSRPACHAAPCIIFRRARTPPTRSPSSSVPATSSS